MKCWILPEWKLFYTSAASGKYHVCALEMVFWLHCGNGFNIKQNVGSDILSSINLSTLVAASLQPISSFGANQCRSCSEHQAPTGSAFLFNHRISWRRFSKFSFKSQMPNWWIHETNVNFKKLSKLYRELNVFFLALPKLRWPLPHSGQWVPFSDFRNKM